jgi:triosephosphate isomerase
VGETLEERDKGVTESVLARQVDALVGKYGAIGLDGG